MGAMQAKRVGAALRQAREAWGFSPTDLAQRANLSEAIVRTAESTGRVDLSSLASLTAAVGGTVDDLLGGRAFWRAPSLALKTTDATFEVTLVRARLIELAAAANAHRALAGFLGFPDEWAARGANIGPAGVSDDVVVQAEDLAKKVRAAAGANDGPIGSIREFAGRLGVACFLADLGTDRLDGVMWREAGSPPCVAANISARGGIVTAIRMTFAHELCHAIFDRPKGDATQGTLEKRTEDAEGREQRANAFAAYLLAPRQGVMRALHLMGWQANSIPTVSHLRSLAQHFGMGVEATAYHLVNCNVWSKSEALKHRTMSVPYTCIDDRERTAPTAEQAVPIERRGSVLDLATQALAAGHISAGRWRELVAVSVHADWRAILAERSVEV